jgi:3-hydroxyacyl-CoA dehydrogenase
MAKPFESVAVVGTGTLGAQIALLAANAGYSVNVFDQQRGAFHCL